MTREEAISCIKQIRFRGYLRGANPFYEQDTEALEMAIQALSQEPTFDDGCQKDMDEAWEQIQKKRKRIPVTLDLTPCDDAEQIDYHDDFATASRKIHDYEERQKQKGKKCGSYNNTDTFKSCSDCKLIGTDSCYMVCGGSKSLYKPKQKSEPCTDADGFYICSECRCGNDYADKFCPNCGARMESEGKE